MMVVLQRQRCAAEARAEQNPGQAEGDAEAQGVGWDAGQQENQPGAEAGGTGQQDQGEGQQKRQQWGRKRDRTGGGKGGKEMGKKFHVLLVEHLCSPSLTIMMMDSVLSAMGWHVVLWTKAWSSQPGALQRRLVHDGRNSPVTSIMCCLKMLLLVVLEAGGSLLGQSLPSSAQDCFLGFIWLDSRRKEWC